MLTLTAYRVRVLDGPLADSREVRCLDFPVYGDHDDALAAAEKCARNMHTLYYAGHWVEMGPVSIREETSA